ADVRQQVEQEGPLLRPADGLEIFKYGTAGSSGTPLVFYVSKMNVQYNKVRYLAREFMDAKDLSVNKTQLKTATQNTAEKLTKIPAGFTVKKGPSWLGDIGSVFASGNFKFIEILKPNPRDLVRELRKDAVGRLAATSGVISAIVSYSGAKLLREL